MQQSSWARGACLVLLVLFLLVCGIHLAGVPHDSGPDGLGLVDGLGAILLVGALALTLSLMAMGRWRMPAYLGLSPSRRLTFARAVPADSADRMVVPLRC